MNRGSSLKGLCAITAGCALLAILFEAAPVAASMTCEGLASLVLPKAKIDSARKVEAGAFTQPGGRGNVAVFAKLPSFCRVSATLTPTKDSDIKTEIWLPAEGWNGKFQAVGNGGWAGTIPYPAMATALSTGYASDGSNGTKLLT